MRTLPVGMATELGKEAIFVRHIYALSATTTQNWTDAADPIYFSSKWWRPKNISFDAAQYSLDPQADSITVEIENIDKSFSAMALAEDLRGKEFDIWRLALDASYNPVGASSTTDASLVFLGYVDEMKIDRKKASIQVYNHMIRWKAQVPRRLHSPTCSWVFKSTDNCTYSAASTEWCNYTWERCVALANSSNFGGFRWIPDLAQTELWWGDKPKQWQKK